MVLIEASDNKNPNKYTLGQREPNGTYNCVLNMLENPFNTAVEGEERQLCKEHDGHIPRNMRIILNMVDLGSPYINVF